MRIKEKLNERLTEQKQYTVYILKKGLFSVAVVTALSMLREDNKTIDYVDDKYAVLILNMDMKQKAAIEIALSDYLVEMVTDEPKKKAITIRR